MDDTGEEVPVSQNPSSDATENKVKINHTEDIVVTILTSCKRYSRKSKVSIVEKEQADRITFVEWMESLDENPTKEHLETAFNTKVAPVLEERERQIQSIIT